jgi:hypothetical protein
VGSTPHQAHTTVPTSACAKHNVRRSNLVQHGESIPQTRVGVVECRPLYEPLRTRLPRGRGGGIGRDVTPSAASPCARACASPGTRTFAVMT